jgi:Ni2+-binding GTPase involved in maturation of urease and hydrogenase
VERIETHIRQVNPRATVIRVSATDGEGLPTWHTWVRQQRSLRRQDTLITPAIR